MWARRLCRSMGRRARRATYENAAHPCRRREARRAVLEVIASAKTTPRRVHVHPRSRPARRRDRRSPARESGAGRARAAPGRRHRRLARRPARHQAHAGVRRRGRQVRAAVPSRSCAAAPTCATTARWSSPTPHRLWCGGRNFAAEYFEGDPARARARPTCRTSGTTSRSTCKARSSCAPASSSRRTGPTRPARRCRKPACRRRRMSSPKRRPSRSSCRAARTRSTTRCSRCSSPAASSPGAASSRSRRTSSPMATC